jgi:hypothetical protein
MSESAIPNVLTGLKMSLAKAADAKTEVYHYHDPRDYIASILETEEGSLPHIAQLIYDELGLHLERTGDKVRWVTKYYDDE